MIVSEQPIANNPTPIFTSADLAIDHKRVADALLSIEGAMLLVDKEYAVSSFAVVYTLRKALSRLSGEKWIKVGHSGTLDPLATGLVILGSKRATRQLTSFLAAPKEYRAEFRLGITTPSYDLEKPITVTHDLQGISSDEVEKTVLQFIGRQLQIPPIFSAIKQGGKPVYAKARKGKEVTIEPKEIEIYNITNLSIELPYVRCTVACSKGTYIRSLAHDIGRTLGTGATLTNLRRTKIGEYSVEDALAQQQLYSFFPSATTIS